MKVLKRTRSLCNVCLSEIPAEIIEKNNKVYIKKYCNQHGKFTVLLEKDAYFYKRVIHKTYPEKRTHFKNVMIPVTHECNLNCKFCYLPKRVCKEITSEEIKSFIVSLDDKVRYRPLTFSSMALDISRTKKEEYAEP